MKQVLSKLVVITLGLLFVTSANAIVINEYFIEEDTGEFTVTNDSAQDIYIFAVGTNAATYADYRVPAGSADLGWDGMVVNQESWDDFSPTLYIGRDVYVSTNEIGSFNSLFAGFDAAILFYVSPDRTPEVNDPIAAGTSASGFTFFAGELASPFVAVNGFGNVIETGLTVEAPPSVPVPAAVWLFGSGLIGLVGVARRKQR